MRFWDASAIVPLFVEEDASPTVRAIAQGTTELAVWWSTVVECAGALARRERRGETDPDQVALARSTLGALAARWIEIPPTDTLRQSAHHLVLRYDIRTADAFQLAAALAASDRDPQSMPLVTLDARLAAAARGEGFTVLP